MSRGSYTVSYVRCNGCGRTDTDGAQIVQSKLKWPYVERGSVYAEETIDMCAECEAQDRFVCTLCRNVHDTHHPCAFMAPAAAGSLEPLAR